MRPKCGSIFPEFVKFSMRKRTKNPRKLPVIRGSMRRQGPRMWLKCDEGKGMICERCVESKQTLVEQNVLKSNKFIDGCISYEMESTSWKN